MSAAMFEVLRSYFERQFPLSDKDFNFVKTVFTPKQFKKGTFLLREGNIATHMEFVAKACLRSYTIDDKGKEHIVQFLPET